MYCSHRYLSTNPKKVCYAHFMVKKVYHANSKTHTKNCGVIHAHSYAHKPTKPVEPTKKIINMNSENIKDEELGFQI